MADLSSTPQAENGGDEQRVSTFRLPRDLAEEVAAVARIEGCKVSEFVRRALRNEVDRLRFDAEFRTRVHDRIAADQRLLERLNEGPSA